MATMSHIRTKFYSSNLHNSKRYSSTLRNSKLWSSELWSFELWSFELWSFELHSSKLHMLRTAFFRLRKKSRAQHETKRKHATTMWSFELWIFKRFNHWAGDIQKVQPFSIIWKNSKDLIIWKNSKDPILYIWKISSLKSDQDDHLKVIKRIT